MEQKKRGNQGWSTAGKAGRPATGQRPPQNMRAYKDEWELIKQFAEIAKKDKDKAKSLLENA